MHLASILLLKFQRPGFMILFFNPLLSMLIDQITPQCFVAIWHLTFSAMGYSRKLYETRVEDMEYLLQEYWRKDIWKSQGSIKKEKEFLVVLKKN